MARGTCASALLVLAAAGLSGAALAAGPLRVGGPPAPVAPAAERAWVDPAARQAAAARVHAQDIADVFGEACLARLGDPEAVADWALNEGFVIDTSAVKEVAAAMRQRGDQGNVFVRPKGDSLLIISTGDPTNCLVMGLEAVDGPRLRGRMEALMGSWRGGTATPEPDRNGDYNQEGPHRSLSWLGVVGTDRYRITVVSPLGTARGTSVMGIALAPRQDAKAVRK
jgi:hypothetical protein